MSPDLKPNENCQRKQKPQIGNLQTFKSSNITQDGVGEIPSDTKGVITAKECATEF